MHARCIDFQPGALSACWHTATNYSAAALVHAALCFFHPPLLFLWLMNAAASKDFFISMSGGSPLCFDYECAGLFVCMDWRSFSCERAVQIFVITHRSLASLNICQRWLAGLLCSFWRGLSAPSLTEIWIFTCWHMEEWDDASYVKGQQFQSIFQFNFELL